MDIDDMEVFVKKEPDKDGRVLYKIQRKSSRHQSTAWWTRNEAEDLFAQLDQVLYKGGG